MHPLNFEWLVVEVRDAVYFVATCIRRDSDCNESMKSFGIFVASRIVRQKKKKAVGQLGGGKRLVVVDN